MPGHGPGGCGYSFETAYRRIRNLESEVGDLEKKLDKMEKMLTIKIENLKEDKFKDERIR